MENGTVGDAINPWGVALFTSLKLAKPTTSTEDAAYSKWLDQTSDREEARQDRVHGAAGIIPTSIWVVLFFTAAIVFAFMLFFADSAERAVRDSQVAIVPQEVESVFYSVPPVSEARWLISMWLPSGSQTKA